MLRSARLLYGLASATPFPIRNIFTHQAMGTYQPLDEAAVKEVLTDYRQQAAAWSALASEQQEQHILNFLTKISQPSELDHCASLLSGCSGKELLECRA
jgi:acyl-CoA reductase-like NAD-dependent aldehyde dehydrogenase